MPLKFRVKLRATCVQGARPARSSCDAQQAVGTQEARAAVKHGGACARLEQARAQLSDQEMQRFAESVATQERSAAAATAGSATTWRLHRPW